MENFLIIILLLLPFKIFAFLLPAETILQNNVAQRAFLKSVVIQHKLHFLEGFYSPIDFSCKETLTYSGSGFLRADYTCDGVSYSLLRTPKSLKTIYAQGVQDRDFIPLHFWPSLFLLSNVDQLIKNLSHHELISMEEETVNEKRGWSIDADVSLVRLGKIEKSTPQKLEKNVAFLVSGGSGKIWFEKDLFLPQKISHEGKDLAFKNYKDYFLNPDQKLSFRYPQKIELQESDIVGVTVETVSVTLNPSLESNTFNPAVIAKKNTPSFSEDKNNKKEILEKFISDFR